MVVDTSALVAILFGETESSRMIAAIVAADARRVGAPTLVEASAVMVAKKGPGGEIALDALLERLDLEVVPMTADGAVHARNAYRQFGKGVGTPGVLNYGDCLSYGVARQLGERLLFKGDDFPRTDVEPAEY